MTVPAVEEPLLESAPIAWRMAPQLCRSNPAGEDCSAMHRTWQYLRLLGLVGSIDKRATFYHEALGALANNAQRVLICGAADYAMLAQVLAAFRSRGIEPDVTMIDLCETPLILNRWYAERVSCSIQTVQGDILKHETATSYDAVCTDAFFGRFAPGQWPVLIEKWRQLLRPGGRVITASRLRSGPSGTAVGFSDGAAQRLHAAVLDQAGRLGISLPVDPTALAAQAALFAARHVTHAVTSTDAMRGLFERGGFRVSNLATQLADVEDRSGQGPAIRNRGHYLNIVASRT